MLQTKVVEKTKTNLLCSVTFFFGNRAVYEVVNIIRCMLIPCWMPKTTNTHTIRNTIFPRQQCLHVRWERSCSMRTDMTKLIVAFRNCGNAPKISPFCPHSVVFYGSRNIYIIFLFFLNLQVFITKTECVYCAVRP
jgi:hypothetical protein